MIQRFLAAALVAAFFMLVALPGPAAAGETATTHRAGDLVAYSSGCTDAEAMIAIAELGGSHELGMVLQAEGKCFRRRFCAGGRFEEWIAGPFPPPRGAPGSVWRVTDEDGETVFIWWADTGGPHEAHPDANL